MSEPRAWKYLKGIEAHGGVGPAWAEVHQHADQPGQAQDGQQDQHRLHRGPAGEQAGLREAGVAWEPLQATG